MDIDASDSEKVIPKNGAKKTAQAASEATTTTTSVRQTPIVSGVNTPLSYSSIAATPVPSVRDAPNSNSGSNDGWQTATGSRSSKSNGWSNSNTPGTRTPATASFSRRGGFAKKEKASPTPYLMENAFYAPGGQAPMVQKKPMSEKKQIFVGAPADDSDWEE